MSNEWSRGLPSAHTLAMAQDMTRWTLISLTITLSITSALSVGVILQAYHYCRLPSQYASRLRKYIAGLSAVLCVIWTVTDVSNICMIVTQAMESKYGRLTNWTTVMEGILLLVFEIVFQGYLLNLCRSLLHGSQTPLILFSAALMALTVAGCIVLEITVIQNLFTPVFVVSIVEQAFWTLGFGSAMILNATLNALLLRHLKQLRHETEFRSTQSILRRLVSLLLEVYVATTITSAVLFVTVLARVVLPYNSIARSITIASTCAMEKIQGRMYACSLLYFFVQQSRLKQGNTAQHSWGPDTIPTLRARVVHSDLRHAQSLWSPARATEENGRSTSIAFDSTESGPVEPEKADV